MRVGLELGHSLDPRSWSDRHTQGAVPDRLPYGLHRLEDQGVGVVLAPSWTDGRRRVDRVLRAVGGRYSWSLVTRRPADDVDVLVSWDERAGVPLGHRRHRPPVATGVIWLTDVTTGGWSRVAVAGLRRCALVWALSTAQLPRLAEMGVPRQRLAHVRFGVDADFFAPGPSTERDPDLLVSVGNDRDRDFPLLLRAFADLRRHRPRARLIVVTRAAIEVPAGVELVAGLSHPALRDLYRSAAAVVVTTRPNLHVSGMTVAMEAKATATPVVLTRTEGAADYVHDGDDGLLVPVGDQAALVTTLRRLLDDPAQRTALGNAGRADVVEHGSTARQAERLAELLEAVH